MVETHGLTARGRVGSRLADGEQSQVVVVARTLRLHEDCSGKGKGQSSEAEHLAVELGGTLGISHVENGVVETMDRHLGLLF
jgi:hypothetical protein